MATQTSNPADHEPRATVKKGNGIAALAGPEVDSSPSNPHRLRLLYEYMLKCSLIRARLSELGAEKRVTHAGDQPFSSLATGVGTLIELRAGDAIGAHDPIVTGVLRHVPLEHLFSELYGFESEYRSSQPHATDRGLHVVPRTSTLAAQFDVAAGMALAARLQNRHSIVMVHAADGFHAIGFWHEAATISARERLPLVFVFESGTPGAAKLDDSTFRDRAETYGMPGITVEGSDVVAVWRVTQESIHRARSGAGPTLIDCRVASAVRPNGKPHDDDSAKALAHMQHYLQKRNFWDSDWQREITKAYSAEIDHAVHFADKISRAQ
jgi:pyruvate dehydrogenase E1 component alpha subunit